MKKLLILIVVISCSKLSAQDVSLTVQIEKLKKLEGKVMIAVYDKEDSFLDQAVTGGIVAATANSVSYSFSDLEEGVYAISIFHDVNGNGKLDTNFVGIPTEPYAFSNNAKGMFGPPNFADCKFEFNGSKQQLIISL